MSEQAPTVVVDPKLAPLLADWRLPDAELGFGRLFAPAVVTARWTQAGGWDALRLEPLADFSLHPAASVLHYGQEVFEGLKAFAKADGQLAVFRPDFHAKRFQRSAKRVCLPELPESWFVASVNALVGAMPQAVPRGEGQSLYLRPTLVATEAFLGVRPAHEVLYFLMASPVGSYWAGGKHALRILIEKDDVRAAVGGLGEAKTGGNYAASLRAAERAKAQGFDQVLWLDAKERRYVEEVGTMNVFFVLGDEVVTPALSGSILAGCTRDAVKTLLTSWGVKVSERPLTVDELVAAQAKGELKACFGTGTAAVISPVGELATADGSIVLKPAGDDTIGDRLLAAITGIQRGAQADEHGWLVDLR